MKIKFSTICWGFTLKQEVRSMKRTFQPKKIHRAKKHGFLLRSKSVNGRKVLAARRRKGRAKLAAVTSCFGKMK